MTSLRAASSISTGQLNVTHLTLAGSERVGRPSEEDVGKPHEKGPVGRLEMQSCAQAEPGASGKTFQVESECMIGSCKANGGDRKGSMRAGLELKVGCLGIH